MTYNFTISAQVEADSEKEALEKINACVDFTNIYVDYGPEEIEVEEDEDESTSA